MEKDPSFPYIFTVVQMLFVAHTIFNPIIYCWMNMRVRMGFMEVLGKFSFARKFFSNTESGFPRGRGGVGGLPSCTGDTRRSVIINMSTGNQNFTGSFNISKRNFWNSR